ncbi:unnamed protein product [Ceutorhynchus assimilis]|uniref:Hexosyltransferase n=1 Tax=Ceutorhynchus assimilis TaxID=467358 RepID=A0A9N9QNW4_9CUCU|nr:unnamed protein product [Ceutorhynchus assimilis]
MKYLPSNPPVGRCKYALWKSFLAAVAVVSVIYLITMNKKCIFTQTSTNLTSSNKEIRYFSNLNPQPHVVPRLNEKDYSRLINLTNFKFIVPNSCSNDNVFLAVIVTSAPKNLEARNTIRSTWGKNDEQVKTFFMLGAVDDADVQETIFKEHLQYHDIVQGNFFDSYFNLTYKTVMALKFITYHCTNATYILKTDDDVFVNMPLLKNFLINDLSPFGAVNCLLCHKMENMPILRGSSKWAVKEEEFLGKIYPTYCNGPYSILSPDVVFKLYQESQRQKYFYIEDVFLYGVVAGKFPEIQHTDIKNYTLWDLFAPGAYKTVRTQRNFLFGFLGMKPENLKEFWEFVKGRPVTRSLYDSVV